MSDKEKDDKPSPVLKYLAGLFKEVGLPGFLVIVITFVFLVFGSEKQKQEFIDVWILMKDVENSPLPFKFVVSALLLIIILGGIMCRRIHRIDKDEIKRVGDEKGRLQQQLLDKKLESSDQ